MTWTVFAAQTAPTLPSLDENLRLIYNSAGNFLCSVSGTNALSLTPTTDAPNIPLLQDGMVFYGLAANTNTASTTAAVGGLGARNVYKDSEAGPVVLAGGEIVADNAIWLTYDSTLNSGTGGYHLQTGGAILRGQTIAVGSLLVGTNGTINFGTALKRLLSSTVAVGFTVIPANLTQDAVALLSGVSLTDNVVANPIGAPGAGLMFNSFVPAAGSVTLRAANVTAASIAAFSATFRLTGLGYS